jgi:hypothetical protein
MDLQYGLAIDAGIGFYGPIGDWCAPFDRDASAGFMIGHIPVGRL